MALPLNKGHSKAFSIALVLAAAWFAAPGAGAQAGKATIRGDRTRMLDARWVHPRHREMSVAYDRVKPKISLWIADLVSANNTNGVLCEWTRKSDGLKVAFDVGVFRNKGYATKAAEVRLDELVLGSVPVTTKNAGAFKTAFQTKALDNSNLGEKVWSRVVSPTRVEMVFLKGRTVVGVVAEGKQSVDVPEVMRLARVTETRASAQ